jgi:transposase
LYRQGQILARQGVELDRSALANWVDGAWWWLELLQSNLAEHVFAPHKTFAGDARSWLWARQTGSLWALLETTDLWRARD